MTAPLVTLNWNECLLAHQIGGMRQIAAMKAGREDRYGFEGAGWNLHIEGAGGELAVCKHKFWYWKASINTFKGEADIGDWIEVRTRSRHDYELIVRPDDNLDRLYVLVTGVMPEYRIHGFMLGREAQRPEWEKTHGGRAAAWFVPQQALNPISELTLDALRLQAAA